jgi:hypothetical protein
VNRDQILRELQEERERLTRAIEALGGSSGATRTYKAASTQSKAKNRSHGITAAGRRRLSELMKKRWAERRKAAKAK